MSLVIDFPVVVNNPELQAVLDALRPILQQLATGAAGGSISGDLNVTGAVNAGAASHQNAIDFAKVIISTVAPTDPPASGVGTFWAQY